MSCSYGSEKKQSAPDFINPNDIGVLCFLFGLEGSLCRLLDLVPSAIKKIATLNPDIGNADEVFGDILKSVAKKSVGLLIDSITGQIEVEQYCLIEPPPQPEDITFSDIFIFIAELVPTLDYFFTANEVLTGESTRILDKIVATWLRKQWFINCQCKAREPQSEEEALENSLITFECAGQSIEQANELITQCNEGNAVAAAAAANQNSGQPSASEIANGTVINLQNIGYYLNPRARTDYVNNPPPEYLNDSYQFGCVNVFVSARQTQNILVNSITVLGTDPNTFEELELYNFQDRKVIPYQISTETDISQCDCGIKPSNPNPNLNEDDITPKFCELFPEDELCNTNACLQVDVEVVEFNGCGQPRGFKTVQLLTSGEVLSVEVVEFNGCNQERQTKLIEYFECEP